MAHGATDNGRCWTRVAEQLEDTYDLVAYDARGHGRSSDIPSSPPTAGQDLLAVVEALGLERPVAMGHSMGAGAVADAASRDPNALRAAILEDPLWRATAMPALTRRPNDNDEQTDAAARQREGRERVRSLTGWVDELQKLSLDEVITIGRRQSPSWHRDEFPAWAESKLQYRPAVPRIPAQSKDQRPARPDWRAHASSIRIPVLLVCGDPSRALVDIEGAEEAATLCPTLEVVRFDTGHNIRREDFEGFVRAVSGFLARVHG
jgi:pimeloyl-ACP methyl ester carboxylesterase